MSDNRRVYRTIHTQLRQLYPKDAKGRVIQHINTMAGLVAGIVQGKSCQLPTIARKVPTLSKPESRVKQYSRWMQNERIDHSGYYLPYMEALLDAANTQTLTFVSAGSQVGDGCITLMVSLIYRKRAIPVTWLVVKGKKGHLPEETHLALIKQLQAVLPEIWPSHCHGRLGQRLHGTDLSCHQL